MLAKIEYFQLAHAMATHAGTRQAVVAQNVANADTPGYKARDTVSFADTLAAQAGGFDPRATRPRHLHGVTGPAAPEIVETGQQNDPNGNGVTIEEETLRAVEVKRQHDRALAIYRSGLNVLRASLGKG
ncbi:MAG: flagellar basal-body rod protein FlgB [Rhodobacteraceae bacterium HLUCCO07]|uniref:FlgB family protein n=1 Tax=Aquicoccus sp. TaxID=2055851 RepID=UPI0006DBBB55|nr:MAG: flagellar basal-body rod protein FlgB [Rhodobacteraceae bacterium HLUCCO07]